ncbi:MAG: hypothetical protein GF347_05685, partial [Candidatus Moranbacteria bacterium]|nr:hypothetical protein [Candidatus Moranbacteria bacterium]
MRFKKNKKYYSLLLLVLLLGIFLRVYRHNDFLHFELDQARDALIVDAALENGIGELPLLGPRAAGTMLR